jgi:hypothetical protein
MGMGAQSGGTAVSPHATRKVLATVGAVAVVVVVVQHALVMAVCVYDSWGGREGGACSAVWVLLLLLLVLVPQTFASV